MLQPFPNGRLVDFGSGGQLFVNCHLRRQILGQEIEQNVVLSRKMQVDGAPADACLGCDLVKRYVFKTLAVENLSRRLPDELKRHALLDVTKLRLPALAGIGHWWILDMRLHAP